jgi:hypothetical protein
MVRLLRGCINFKSYLIKGSVNITEYIYVFMEYEKKNETGANTKSGLMPGGGGGASSKNKVQVSRNMLHFNEPSY